MLGLRLLSFPTITNDSTLEDIRVAIKESDHFRRPNTTTESEPTSDQSETMGDQVVRDPLHSHFIPNTYDTPSCIVLPDIAALNYEIKPSTIQNLPKFNGLSHEEPYQHIDEFTAIY